MQIGGNITAAHCPECGKNINLLTAKSIGFSCPGCGIKMVVGGGVVCHVFAMILFIIETMVLFAFVQTLWIAIVAIILLVVANYYLSFRLFLRVKISE